MSRATSAPSTAPIPAPSPVSFGTSGHTEDVGAVAWLLDIPMDMIEKSLAHQFRRKPKAVPLNMKSIEMGYEYMVANHTKKDPYRVAPMTGKVEGKNAKDPSSSDLTTTMTNLKALGDKRGLAFGTASTAQDQNAFATTTAFCSAGPSNKRRASARAAASSCRARGRTCTKASSVRCRR